jgi:hypothetical protein
MSPEAARPCLTPHAVPVVAGALADEGVDYKQRHADRAAVFAHGCGRASDSFVQGRLYAWGVKYVVDTAPPATAAELGTTFLDGHVKLVFAAGPLHIYRVQYPNEAF